MAHLKPLKTVTVLSFLTNNIEDGVNKLSAFSVMSLGPVVTSTRLAEYEVIGTEGLTVGSRSETVHGARLQIHEYSTRDESSAASFVVVDVDALELEI